MFVIHSKWTAAVFFHIYKYLSWLQHWQEWHTFLTRMQACGCTVSKASAKRIWNRRRIPATQPELEMWKLMYVTGKNTTWCLHGCNSRALAKASWRLAAALSYIRKPMNQNSWPSMDTTWMYFSAGLNLLTEGLAALSWWRGMTTYLWKVKRTFLINTVHLFNWSPADNWTSKWIKQQLGQKIQVRYDKFTCIFLKWQSVLQHSIQRHRKHHC